MHLQRSTHPVLYLEARPQFICSAAGERGEEAGTDLGQWVNCDGSCRPVFDHRTQKQSPSLDSGLAQALGRLTPADTKLWKGLSERSGDHLGLLSGGSWGRAELIVCIENCNRILLLSASYHAEKKYRLKAMGKGLGIYKNKSLILARSRYRSRVSDTPSDIAQGIEADFDGITFDPTNPLPIHPCLPQYWFREMRGAEA